MQRTTPFLWYDGKAEEADLTPDDLKDGFLIGNMVRGLMKARLA